MFLFCFGSKRPALWFKANIIYVLEQKQETVTISSIKEQTRIGCLADLADGVAAVFKDCLQYAPRCLSVKKPRDRTFKNKKEINYRTKNMLKACFSWAEKSPVKSRGPILRVTSSEKSLRLC